MESKTVADLDLLLEQQFESERALGDRPMDTTAAQDMILERGHHALVASIDKAIQSERIESLVDYKQRLEGYQYAIDAEIKRLRVRADRLDRKINRVVAGLEFVSNGQSFECPLFKLSWRESKSCEVVDPALVPDAYIRTKVVREIDKSSALTDLKSGEEIPGLKLRSKLNINIK
jgi:hypothetical protein